VRAAARRRGFTLLEVMVALAILAGALLAISDVVSGALRNHVRARHLEVATLLARGKLAELEDHYEAEGFKIADESEEGTFDEEGHPEVRWRVEVVAPPGDLGPDAVLAVLTGSPDGLDALLPPPEETPQLAAFRPMLEALLAQMAEQLKRGARELRLTVSWPEAGGDESFEVKTHLVVLTPGKGLATP
jgi:general secretion pathway protein I